MTSEAYVQKQTAIDRLWRALGFHYHLGEEPEGINDLKGWMRTDISIGFSLVDRIRLLLTGELRVVSVVHTDTESPSVCKSRVDWRIVRPGGR